MKKNLIIILGVMICCILLTGCASSKRGISREQLKEEVSQTSPGEVYISPELPEEEEHSIKLLKRRRPLDIFAVLREEKEVVESEEIALPDTIREEDITPDERAVIQQEKEELLIAKKDLPDETAQPVPKNGKDKAQPSVDACYIPALELWNGECLVYQMSWNSIGVGKGMLACSGINNSFGDVYHILGLSIPDKSFLGSKMSLYRMDAYLDKETLQPYYYYQYGKSSDGKEDILEIRFDWKNKKYFTQYKKYDKGKLYSTKEKTLSLPHTAHDSISIFYVVRTLDLDNSSSFTIPIAMRDIWDLTIQTLGKKTVNIPCKGKGDVYVLQPQAKSDTGFFTKGAMDLWLTADNKRLPVYLEGRVALGKARMSLIGEKKLSPGATLNTETITNILSEFN